MKYGAIRRQYWTDGNTSGRVPPGPHFGDETRDDERGTRTQLEFRFFEQQTPFEVEPAAATGRPPGPLNWRWFRARRRELGGFLTSFVAHAGMILVLVLLRVLLEKQSVGVFLSGSVERRDVIELPPVRLDSSAPPLVSAGESVDIHPAEDSIPEPGAVPVPEIASKGPTVEPREGPVGEIRKLFGPGEDLARPVGQLRAGAEFFGIKAAGDRFVFVVDSSWSMRGVRWEQATQELQRAVERLRSDHSFYAIFFDAVAHPMFDDGQPGEELVSATAENAARLQQRIEAVELGYETDPLPAVQRAVELRPDAVFLLSDGEFDEQTLNYLRAQRFPDATDKNQRPPTVVHTVALHSRKGEEMLKRIALENGGEYRFVTDPRPTTAEVLRQKAVEKALKPFGAEFETDEFGRVYRVKFVGQDVGGLDKLQELPYVEEIWLPESNLDDTGLKQLCRLSEPRLLVLSRTAVSDEGLRHLAAETRLEGLFLDGTQVTDDGMKHVAELVHLRVLSTPGHLTDAGLKHLSGLSELETLYLVEPQVTDRGLDRIEGLHELKRLVLVNTQVTDGGLSHLQDLANLESLHLGGTRVEGPGLACLTGAPLRELDLGHTAVDDSGLAYVSQLEQLVTLNLESTRVTDAGMKHLQRLAHLRHVTLSAGLQDWGQILNSE